MTLFQRQPKTQTLGRCLVAFKKQELLGHLSSSKAKPRSVDQDSPVRTSPCGRAPPPNVSISSLSAPAFWNFFGVLQRPTTKSWNSFLLILKSTKAYENFNKPSDYHSDSPSTWRPQVGRNVTLVSVSGKRLVQQAVRWNRHVVGEFLQAHRLQEFRIQLK